MTDGILNHLILVYRKATGRPFPFEFPNRATNEKIQDRKKDKNEDNSIHSGVVTSMPQSYGRDRLVSRIQPAVSTENPKSLLHFSIAQTA